jgi:hypothetical protein
MLAQLMLERSLISYRVFAAGDWLARAPQSAESGVQRLAEWRSQNNNQTPLMPNLGQK